MNYTKLQWWERFQKYYTEFPELGLAIDLSRVNVNNTFFAVVEPKIQKAFAEMDALEKGAIADPDENRMVGHYWLRNPVLAPTPEIRQEIETTFAKIKDFAGRIHSGAVKGTGGEFKNILVIGIGGSALGPQFAAQAPGNPRKDKLKLFFFDSTDPEGVNNTLAAIGKKLDRTLCIVISKSGDTQEIPMRDWVGGRTSGLSAVGLLPAAPQEIDIDGLLAGGRLVDSVTRRKTVKDNPMAQLALAWHVSGNVTATGNMAVLPYKDQLELFLKHLQQLNMESMGGKSPCTKPDVIRRDFLQEFFFGNKASLAENSQEAMSIIVNEANGKTVWLLIALFKRKVGFYANLVNVNTCYQFSVSARKKAVGKLLMLLREIITFSKSNINRSFAVEKLAVPV